MVVRLPQEEYIENTVSIMINLITASQNKYTQHDLNFSN